MNKRQLKSTLRRVLTEMNRNAATAAAGQMADQEAALEAERNVRRINNPDALSDLLADMIYDLDKPDLDGLYGAIQKMSDEELGAALSTAVLMVAG